METKETKEYMNVSALADELFKLFQSEREDERKAVPEEGDALDHEVSDDFLREYAMEMAIGFDSDMNKYLHMKDTRIQGNFNNIRWDYPRENEGETFEEMVARLDANEQSERATKDRDYLNAWFWETFGTFGLAYNFNDLMNSLVEDFEHDKVVEFA